MQAQAAMLPRPVIPELSAAAVVQLLLARAARAAAPTPRGLEATPLLPEAARVGLLVPPGVHPELPALALSAVQQASSAREASRRWPHSSYWSWMLLSACSKLRYGRRRSRR
jgi:hypothetical protein